MSYSASDFGFSNAGQLPTSERTDGWKVGQPVRLCWDVDIFPEGIVERGETGTIVSLPADQYDQFRVKLDTPHEWLGEWGNCLLFHDLTGEVEAI